MSGETEDQVSGWTTDTLREFLISLLGEHDKRYEQRFAAQEKATRAALDAAERVATIIETETRAWRVAQDGWRQAMDDNARQFLPRTEAAVLDQQNALSIAKLINDLGKLEDRFNERENQRKGVLSAASVAPVLIGALLALLGIVSFFNGAA